MVCPRFLNMVTVPTKVGRFLEAYCSYAGPQARVVSLMMQLHRLLFAAFALSSSHQHHRDALVNWKAYVLQELRRENFEYEMDAIWKVHVQSGWWEYMVPFPGWTFWFIIICQNGIYLPTKIFEAALTQRAVHVLLLNSFIFKRRFLKHGMDLTQRAVQIAHEWMIGWKTLSPLKSMKEKWCRCFFGYQKDVAHWVASYRYIPIDTCGPLGSCDTNMKEQHATSKARANWEPFPGSSLSDTARRTRPCVTHPNLVFMKAVDGREAPPFVQIPVDRRTARQLLQ